MQTGIKMIVLDDPTQKFLSVLRATRESAGMSRSQIARSMNIPTKTFQMYELGLCYPSLGNLMRLAEILRYDLSDSVNYKFFHGKLNPYEIKQKLKRYDLSYREISEATGYTRDRISCSILMRPKGSLHCLHAVLEVIRREQELEKFRSKHCLTQERRTKNGERI